MPALSPSFPPFIIINSGNTRILFNFHSYLNLIHATFCIRSIVVCMHLFTTNSTNNHRLHFGQSDRFIATGLRRSNRIDSITIALKDCLTGFYMPNAFTPDGNGLNDLIKPFLFGRVATYEFSIYNRFGERIFSTTTLTQGWNGVHRNQPQPSGVFSWKCSWQMEGEKPQQRSGTLYLIR